MQLFYRKRHSSDTPTQPAVARGARFTLRSVLTLHAVAAICFATAAIVFRQDDERDPARERIRKEIQTSTIVDPRTRDLFVALLRDKRAEQSGLLTQLGFAPQDREFYPQELPQLEWEGRRVYHGVRVRVYVLVERHRPFRSLNLLLDEDSRVRNVILVDERFGLVDWWLANAPAVIPGR